MLPSGWTIEPLHNLVFFQEGPGLRNWQYRDAGIPFVNIRCIKEGRLLRSEMTCLDPAEVEAKYRHFLLDAGDYVVSSSGTLGRLAEVRREDLPCMLNTSVIRFRPAHKDAIDRRYLKYYLLSEHFSSQVLAHANGSAQLNYGPSHLKQMSIVVPPLAEQRMIGDLLGCVDDYIGLLRETNSNLESIAQTIFKSWFVDFDPVRAKAEGREPVGMDAETAALFPYEFEESVLGSIPKGWRVGSILEAAALLSGGTPKTDITEYWGGEIPWASAKDVSQSGGSVLVSTERTITQKGLECSSTRMIPAMATVVVARGATTGRMALLGREMAMNQTCYALKSNNHTPIALYCLLRREIDALVNAAHGSVFDTITTSTFAQSKVVHPELSILERFEQIAGPLFEMMVEATAQARTLATLRDTLLPRLVSGKLRLPEAEEALEEAVT